MPENDTTALAGVANHGDFTLIGLLIEADVIVKIVLVILLFFQLG